MSWVALSAVGTPAPRQQQQQEVQVAVLVAVLVLGPEVAVGAPCQPWG